MAYDTDFKHEWLETVPDLEIYFLPTVKDVKQITVWLTFHISFV